MYWQRLECKYANKITHKGSVLQDSTIIIPAAGLGSRFKNVYNKPKPLIDVNNSPMYKEAINLSFNPENVVIVTRKDLEFYKEFKDSAESNDYTWYY